MQSACSPLVAIPSRYQSAGFCRRWVHRQCVPASHTCVSVLQDLLNEPNPGSPAQSTAYEMYLKDKPQHQERVRKQALLYPPPF